MCTLSLLVQRRSLFEHVVFSPVVCVRISRSLFFFSWGCIRILSFIACYFFNDLGLAGGFHVFSKWKMHLDLCAISPKCGSIPFADIVNDPWFALQFPTSSVKMHPDFELALRSFTLLQSLVSTDNHGNPDTQLSCAPQATNGCRSRERAWWKTISRNVNVSERMICSTAAPKHVFDETNLNRVAICSSQTYFAPCEMSRTQRSHLRSVFEIFLPGLSLTPRKFGTTRLRRAVFCPTTWWSSNEHVIEEHTIAVRDENRILPHAILCMADCVLA